MDNDKKIHYAELILKTESTISGKAWWSSIHKRRIENSLATLLQIPAMPIILLSMSGIKLLNKVVPIVEIPIRSYPEITNIAKIKTLRDKHSARVDKLIEYKSLKNNPDILKLGKILRRTSVDELPQLQNIRNGNLALVGPRPIHSDIYANEILPYLNHYDTYKVFDINLKDGLKSGATGMGVIFARNQPWDERFQFDNLYAERASLIGDLRIITISCILPLILSGK